MARKIRLDASLELQNLHLFLATENLWAFNNQTEPIVIDASKQRWIEPGPLVALTTALLAQKRDNGASIYTSFGGASNTSFYDRMKFFTLLACDAPERAWGQADESGRFITLTSFETLSDVSRFVKQAAAILNVDATEIGPYVSRSFEEAMRNAVQHTGPNPIRLLAAQRFPKQKRVQLAICDSGIGILKSLRRDPTIKVKDAKSALLTAIRPGISGARLLPCESEFERNQGFGLFLMIELTRRTYGTLILATGDRLLMQNGKLQHIFKIKPICGTILVIEFHDNYLQEFFTLQNELIAQLP